MEVEAPMQSQARWHGWHAQCTENGEIGRGLLEHGFLKIKYSNANLYTC